MDSTAINPGGALHKANDNIDSAYLVTKESNKNEYLLELYCSDLFLALSLSLSLSALSVSLAQSLPFTLSLSLSPDPASL